ncbi:hypothetical protein [Streptomyces crystallinus]|uniref:Uncharacterized protein n=1 Tax=Streptomyces crystallinus TaxID=68191 RepID=A0ABN1GJ34_9ACTN
MKLLLGVCKDPTELSGVPNQVVAEAVDSVFGFGRFDGIDSPFD